MTGCPNGCARPYTAEVGLVGRSLDSYSIYLGGSPLGTRVGQLYRDNVKRGAIAAVLEPLFQRFRTEGQPGESFGDFCHRIGLEQLEGVAAG